MKNRLTTIFAMIAAAFMSWGASGSAPKWVSEIAAPLAVAATGTLAKDATNKGE